MSRPLLKYCGNKSLSDLEITLQSHADYIGFVFAESKRQVSVSDAAAWVEKVQLNRKELVGVFVNQSIEEIAAAKESVPLSVIQCHGEEDPAFIKELKAIIKTKVWKVIHHENEDSIKRMKAYKGLVDGYVIDKKAGNVYGGTGTSFDWTYIPAYLRQAEEEGVPCLIAGGINENSILDLLPYKPFGIDISSGIERNMRKSSTLINLIESKVMMDGIQHSR